jgi:superfamily I DNA/RNA helicase
VEVIDFLLAGGIKDGSWAIFYDENQNIYGGLTDSAMNKLTEARPFKFPLRVNCRNTRAIARATAVLSGLEPAPVMKVEGPEVEVIWYKDERHQRREISRVIGRWLSEGVSLPQITIISPKAFHRSGLAGGLESTISYRLLDWNKDEPPPEDNISFSTIHSFKGLESDMVIMAYIDDAGDGGRP